MAIFNGTNDSERIAGSAFDDSLFGFGGNDRLVGDGGADDLFGGSGLDTAVYDTATQSVTVFVSSDLNATLGTGDAAGDRFFDIENVTGSAFADIIGGNDGKNALRGGGGGDILKGAGGADFLQGDLGDDNLQGGSENDRLDGGAGADKIDGGTGVDLALYSGSTFGVTVDLATGVGSGGDAQGDTLSNVENVDGSRFADTLTGNAVGNEIFGGEGQDTIKGFGGADRLDGGEGVDTLIGGAGDDVYVVDDRDEVIDELFGSGNDTVETDITYTLNDSDVEGDVENLTLIGDDDVNGVGNALANVLTGNDGANNLNGNSGADRMIGRGGNDNYVVNEVGDVVDESVAGGGIDGILSFVSLSLSGSQALGNVENLRLATGTAALNAAGNGLANQLTGNNGANDLMGLGGNDVLTGGGGADNFVFNAPLNATTNVDEITDFSVPLDTIRLENAFMQGLATGTLAASAFRIGTGAADATDRIVYNEDTGDLFFDRDGAGGAAAVRFAELDADLAMTNADFFIV